MKPSIKVISLGLAICAATAITGISAKAQSGAAPFAGGQAPAEGKDPEVEKLEAEAAKLAKSSIKSKDAKVKDKVAEAYYKAGHTAMVSEKLGRRQKYVLALKHFRTALSYNPKHAAAKSEKETIEAIYKQMGRPIPQ